MARELSAASRIRGSLLGMACGDAVGTTVEFSPRGSFPEVKDMTGGGPFRLKAGQWTDDTSLGLCLAESLIECGKFDMTDQLTRYCQWFSHGHLSSNGRCFDIGNTTRMALNKFQSNRKNAEAGPVSEQSAGNGSLMRLCAAPLAFWQQPHVAMEAAYLSSITTHGAPQARDSCRFYAGLLVGCMRGVSKEDLLSSSYSPEPGYWEKRDKPVHPAVKPVMDGSYKHSNPPEIKGTGYVVKTLEAALWAFYHTDDFESGCLKVVNLGDDADTTAAVYGQLAGAFYGVEGIPKKWLDKCALSPLIELMADEIVSMADHYSSVKPAAPLDTAEFVSTSAACSDEPVAPADETQASASSETSASGKFKASEHYRQKKRGYDLLEAEVRTHRSSRAVREEIRGSRSAYDIILEKYRKLPPDSQDECLLTSTMNQLYRA